MTPGRLPRLNHFKTIQKRKVLFNKFIELRRAIYIILGTFDELINRKNDFVVLYYHSINNDGWRFSVKPKEFKKQMRYMLKHYSNVDLEEVVTYLTKNNHNSKSSFLVTFDDGYKNLLEVAPYLMKLGVKPTLFVISDREKLVRKSIGTKRPLLSDDDLKKLMSLGWNIESHGKTHRRLTELTKDCLAEEIKESKMDLERISGKNVVGFSYPHGKYSDVIIDAVKSAGYKIAFSTDDIPFGSKANKYAVPRVGVDGTHTFAEFKYLALPSVLAFRKLVKSTFLGRYL